MVSNRQQVAEPGMAYTCVRRCLYTTAGHWGYTNCHVRPATTAMDVAGAAAAVHNNGVKRLGKSKVKTNRRQCSSSPIAGPRAQQVEIPWDAWRALPTAAGAARHSHPSTHCWYRQQQPPPSSSCRVCKPVSNLVFVGTRSSHHLAASPRLQANMQIAISSSTACANRRALCTAPAQLTAPLSHT
jgi:hypothetical protein